MFLKQINSSLVDSNMLVRCVTLSLDRFENQVDMKGQSRLEAVWPSHVAAFTLLLSLCPRPGGSMRLLSQRASS